MKSYRTTTARAALFAALLACVAAAALWMFVVRQLFALRRDAAALSEDMAAISAKEENAQSLERLLQDIAPARAHIAAIQLDADRAAFFIEALEKAGALANVALDIQSAQLSGADAARAPTLELLLVARGTFRNVLHFAELVELLSYQLQALDIRFTRTDNDVRVPWELYMRLQAFNYIGRQL